MDNITDYVRWVGGTDFKGRPFSRVDNLVFCQLSYLDLRNIPGINDKEAPMTLREAVTDLTNLGLSIRKMAPDDSERFTALVRAAANSKRFGDLYITSFTDILNEEDSIQFSAMTFSHEPAGGWAFIAFRGTDSTIAGWKEDFMTSFQLTSSQTMAEDYLRSGLEVFGTVTVGGHSKGGNLAVYSAAVLPDDLFARVDHIYTNDGPGFCPEVLRVDLIKRVNHKTTRIVPQFSVVGSLFAPAIDDSYIVISDKQMADQHELCSWGIDHGDLLITNEGIDPLAARINSGIDRWIYSVDINERKRFINAFFDSMSEDGTQTLEEFTAQGTKGWERLLNVVLGDDEGLRIAAASLPDQLFLDGEGRKITRSGLYRQFRRSDLAKGLAMILAGLLIFLIPEGFMFILVSVLLLAATVISVILTVKKVKKDNWNFQPHLVDATVSSALLAATVITFVKEGALFVMASGIFAALLFACSYNCMARAKKTHNRKYAALLIIMSAVWAVSGIYILFAPENTLMVYMIIVGILAICDGIIRVVKAYSVRHRWYVK
ncbi:MAG: DUF2974 domain-containing protein [Clostridiales bacterium]|nr:DUF2974 domain-containing protein [Clostridiales bacterium]